MQRLLWLIPSLAAALWLGSGTPHAQQAAGGLSQLVWFDRSGTQLSVVGGPGDLGNLELSPDGQHVSVAITDPTVGTRDIWVMDTERGERVRITSSPEDENWSIWSPDGLRVMYNSCCTDLNLFAAAATGTGPSELVISNDEAMWPVSWSPDGMHVLIVTSRRVSATAGVNDVWVLPLSGDRQPYPLLQSDASENWAAFSPDGRWIAFSSSETGQPEVYVMPFPATDQRQRISTNGGSGARWRRDGRELYYVALQPTFVGNVAIAGGTLMAAAVNGEGDSFMVERPEPLFETRFPYPPFHSFDVSADGQRFLVNALVASPNEPSVVASN